MTRYTFIFSLAFLMACSTNEPKQRYVAPKNKDINNIIQAIIYQNHLPVLKYLNIIDTVYDDNGVRRIFRMNNAPLCVDLQKFNVIRLQRDTIINGLPAPPPPPNSLILENILSLKVGGKKFFDQSDSSYFFFLNGHVKAFRISKNFEANISTTTYLNNLILRKLGEWNPFYHISIPLFSEDNMKAYVIVGFSCFLCGFGTGVYLKKVNNKWEIVKTEHLWDS